MNDEYYMSIALQQAKMAESLDEVPVGAVLVNAEGEVIAKAHNLVRTLKDPTAHAEVIAIREAAKLHGLKLTGVSIYVNMEPCPMCAGAIVLSQMRRLIYAVPSPYGGAESLFNIVNNPYLNCQLEITAGCLEVQAKRMIKDFFLSKR